MPAFLPQVRYNGILLRDSRLDLSQLCGGLLALACQLACALGELLLALTIEQDAVLCAVQLQRSLADEILVLAQFGIQVIDVTVQPLLLRFQFRERLGVFLLHLCDVC